MSAAAGLRALADALSETHMYYDFDGEGDSYEDGLGPTQAAMLARTKPPSKVDLLRWAADAADVLHAWEGDEAVDALLARLASLVGEREEEA